MATSSKTKKLALSYGIISIVSAGVLLTWLGALIGVCSTGSMEAGEVIAYFFNTIFALLPMGAASFFVLVTLALGIATFVVGKKEGGNDKISLILASFISNIALYAAGMVCLALGEIIGLTVLVGCTMATSVFQAVAGFVTSRNA